MSSFFDLSTPAKRFRFVAVAEAITWAALLIAMYFKWVQGHEAAVRIPGMVHGVVFLAFVAVSFLTAYALKWNLLTLGLALVSSIPPFGTLIFEWWARRAGHLAELSEAAGVSVVGETAAADGHDKIDV
jgi:integral membrane protein